MNIVPFSLELVQQFYESADPFPIDFDAAWVWVEYSRKDNAKRALLNLEEGIDFFAGVRKTPSGGRPSEIIHLSYNGFKHFALLSQTPKGRKVRQALIDFEVTAKKKINELQARIVYLESRVHALPSELPKVVESLQILGVDIHNPRWNQALQDFALNLVLGDRYQPALPPVEKWQGVVEIAEELGYLKAADIGVRSRLGRFVSKRAAELGIERLDTPHG